MKKFGIVIGVCLLLILSVTVDISAADSNDYKAASSVDLILQSYEKGQISLADKIYFNIKSIYIPEELPAEFRSTSDRPIKSATPYIDEAYDNWDILDPDQQSTLSALLARPTTELMYISPDGHFAINYDTTGLGAVPLEDLDEDGIPDFVERIGLYVDSSYRFYHYELGYLRPPEDGDTLYDIFILRLGNYFGGTFREGPGDSSWNDYESHIELNNNYSFALPNDDPEGKEIGAMKVTCAHEYFHATQLAYAYKPSPDLWWTEGSAVFFEDVVFDVVNDHYYYLPYFFNFPDTFLIDTNYFSWTYHDYSTFIFPSYINEKFGINSIRNVWEYLRWYDPLASIDSVLLPYGWSMQTVFPEFTSWNYFTGNRADTVYHDDGEFYPHILIDQVLLTCEFSGVTPARPPDGLASNYIMAMNDPSQNGLLYLNFDGSNSVKWGFSYIAFDNDSASLTWGCPVSSVGRTSCGIYDFARYDSIMFIPCVVSKWQDDNQYVFDTEVHPFGDVDGSGDVNILDATYLMNYLYKSGLPPKYDYYMGDPNCSGNINILDVSYLIIYLYKQGPEPCAYRP